MCHASFVSDKVVGRGSPYLPGLGCRRRPSSAVTIPTGRGTHRGWVCEARSGFSWEVELAPPYGWSRPHKGAVCRWYGLEGGKVARRSETGAFFTYISRKMGIYGPCALPKNAI